MQIMVKAKSSGESPYDVAFVESDGLLTVTCNCSAGIFGKLCKHKTELISGDAERLHDSAELEKMALIAALVARAPGIAESAAEIAETERLIKAAQTKNKNAKTKFETMLKTGIPLYAE